MPHRPLSCGALEGFSHSRAPSPLLFAEWFSRHLPLNSSAPISLSGALSGAGAGAPSGSGGRKRGRPFGSKNRVKDPAVTPPVPRRCGRPLGSHNKKTLSARGCGRCRVRQGGSRRRRRHGPRWGGCLGHHQHCGPRGRSLHHRPHRDSPRGSGRPRRHRACGWSGPSGPRRRRHRWLVRCSRRQGAQAPARATATVMAGV
jgi:hypothetical protein